MPVAPAKRQKRSFLRTNILFPISILLLLCALLAGHFYFYAEHQHERQATIQHQNDLILAEKLGRKKHDLEWFFKAIYQSSRAISMLPSVTAIRGGNRKSEAEDVIASGRFSEDGAEAVQQLYNNLVTNASVSEVYCVIEGLDHKQGEIPFFMYDSSIVRRTSPGIFSPDQQEEQAPLPADYPKELEDLEYAHYPLQIAYFKEHYPVFNFLHPDDIPVLMSPAMRTCDNSQYLSKSEHNVDDTLGILYSVPFYGPQDRLKGIISTIFRLNVIEAQLLDVPFLVLTENDRQAAAEAGFAMSKKASRFVLLDHTNGNYVYDRRNRMIAADLPRLREGNLDGYLVTRLEVKGSKEMHLAYRLDSQIYQAALAGVETEFRIKHISFSLICLLAISFVGYSFLRKYRYSVQIERISQVVTDISSGSGDLRQKLSMEERGLFGQLCLWFNKFIGAFASIVEKVAAASQQLVHQAVQLKTSSADLSRANSEQQAAVETLSASMQEMNENSHLLSQDSMKLHSAMQQSNASMQTLLADVGALFKQADSLQQANNQTVVLSQDITLATDQIVNEIHHLEESIHQVNHAAGEIGRAIQSVSSHTRDQENLARRVREHAATTGVESVQQTIAGMARIETEVATAAEVIQRLNGFAENISAVVQVIEEIAEQTNLLALNASIVAAQAGEHGAGFAVVANEVRSLSVNTKSSVGEVRELVGELQRESQVAVESIAKSSEKVRSGVELSQRTETALNSIIASTGDSLQMASRVKESMEQQDHNVQQIVSALDQVGGLIAEIRSSSDQQRTGTHAVLKASENTRDFLANVSHSIDQQNRESQKVGELLELLAEKMEAVANALMENERVSGELLGTINLIHDQARQNNCLGQELESAADGLNQQARELAESIKKFKV